MTLYSPESKIEISDPNLQILDRTDLSKVIDYEERFYKSYIHLEKQQLIRKIWDFDDTCGRIKTKIPYEDQLILNFCEDGHIFGAMAFNVSEKAFQYSEFGFRNSTPQPEAKPTHICEILTLFSEKNKINRRSWEHICRMLDTLGFSDVLATTAPRPLPLYQRIFQFEVVDCNVIDGETRYFIHLNLCKFLTKESPII